MGSASIGTGGGTRKTVARIDWAALDVATGAAQAPKPDGAFTAFEYASNINRSLGTAREKLQEGVRRGTIERIRVGFSSFYRLKEDGR